MQRIVVCVKSELDATGPIFLIEPTVKINTKDLVPILNPADHAALALVRSCIAQEDGQITVLTVGPPSADKVLRTCLATGADSAVRVWDDSFMEEKMDAKNISLLLSKAIKKLDAELIVCGSESLCETSGYVGPALAELLDAVQICKVDFMQCDDGDGSMVFHRKHNYGNREVISSSLPAVVTVDFGAATPPVVSMKESIKAKKMPITLFDLAELACESSEINADANANILQYIPPRPRTKKLNKAPDKPMTKQQKMQMMLGGGASKKNSSVVEGNPKQAAKEFIDFLIAQRIL